ncbi:MAG: HDIG domain-containing protein [Actinobacteria bacterium]|nr:HDIG domain-containing protein [Actinomycetota bacterium]
MIARNKNNKELPKTEKGKLEKAKDFINKYFSFSSKIAQRMYIFILTLGLVVAILTYSYSPDIGIELGKPSPRTIKANKGIEFEDVEKTEEDKNKNEAGVEDVYAYDIDVLNGEEGALYQIKYFYLLTSIVQKKEDKTFEEKVDYMTNLLGSKYPESIISLALNLSVDDLNMLLTKTPDIAREIMKEEIKPTEVDFARSEASRMVEADKDIKPENIPVITDVLEKNIQPTAVFNPVDTEEARKEARLNTSPCMVTILEGQTIVFEGEIINDNDILILTKLGLLQTGFNWKRLLYIFFISSVLLVIFGFYIYKFNLNIFNNTKKIVIIALLMIIFTALIKVLTILSSIHLNFWNYLFPIIAASLICTILFNERMGMMLTVCLGIFAGIATDFDFSIAIVYILGGIFSTYMVSKVSQRSAVMRAGFISSLVLAFLFLIINLIGGEIKTIALYTVLGVVNGIICAIIAIGFLPFIESIFNIVTAMGLLELSNTDQPLLKELLISAPGTYNHSILVGHLAESAAKSIGADSLLVKVAALYHDLGKMKRPEYFYENQKDIENIHDRLNPSLSRHIISNHIKDGLDMAVKNKIPRKVLNIISQHHGSSIITYFYEKQKDRELITNGSSNGLKEHFRYPARKPQSKEAAILMLADSTEAAVRSIDKMTPKKIEKMINDIFEDRLKDGQLNETDMTVKEINTVKETLIDGLMSIYHSRLSYTESNSKTKADLEAKVETK